LGWPMSLTIVNCVQPPSKAWNRALKNDRVWPHSVCVSMVVWVAPTSALAFFRQPVWQRPAAFFLPMNLPSLTLLGITAFLAGVSLYQQLRLRRTKQRTTTREELFRIIGENAADMIAVVNVDGRRLYNSPSYERTLGYSPEELGSTSAFAQIHPEDRQKVLAAAEQARTTGIGKRLEYRIRHKDGSWLVFESSASVVLDAQGAAEKLVIVNRDITERKRFEEKLKHDAFHDSLTDLPNRALLLDRLRHAYESAKRDQRRKYAVLLIDLDGFKIFNDTMGYTTGDQLIIDIGRRLTDCLRQHDTISSPVGEFSVLQPGGNELLARLGGDVFTVLLDPIHDPSDAMRVARRIQAALAPSLLVRERKVFTSASIGIALGSETYTKAEDILRDAAIAMYRAKVMGRSHCQLFDKEMHTHVVNRLKLETDLHLAIERKEFRLYYQPIVHLQSGRIAGFEALLRWQHPEMGILSPYKFIDLAEETGMIVPIGRWALREACRQAQAWQSKYPSGMPLTTTVNVSAKQFAHVNLVNDVEAAIQDSGVGPGRLQLEITESLGMADPERTNRVLLRLKRLGVRISLDDFGTGHSSLSRLQGFPADVLKIDRSFVANMEENAENLEVVRLIVRLAQTFGLKVIAEGVETAAQEVQLKVLGCEFGQGYLYSRPVDSEAAGHVLEAKTSGSNQPAGQDDSGSRSLAAGAS